MVAVFPKSSNMNMIFLFKPCKNGRRTMSTEKTQTFIATLSDFSDSWPSLSVSVCLYVSSLMHSPYTGKPESLKSQL